MSGRTEFEPIMFFPYILLFIVRCTATYQAALDTDYLLIATKATNTS